MELNPHSRIFFKFAISALAVAFLHGLADPAIAQGSYKIEPEAACVIAETAWQVSLLPEFKHEKELFYQAIETSNLKRNEFFRKFIESRRFTRAQFAHMIEASIVEGAKGKEEVAFEWESSSSTLDLSYRGIIVESAKVGDELFVSIPVVWMGGLKTGETQSAIGTHDPFFAQVIGATLSGTLEALALHPEIRTITLEAGKVQNRVVRDTAISFGMKPEKADTPEGLNTDYVLQIKLDAKRKKDLVKPDHKNFEVTPSAHHH